MKWVRTAEFQGGIPGDRRERAKDQRWGTWKLPYCPQTALVLLKQLPDKNAGCVSVRPGRHLARDQSARICGWLPWKPMKAVFAPLLHNTYFPEENLALLLLSFHHGRPSSHRKESNTDSLEVGVQAGVWGSGWVTVSSPLHVQDPGAIQRHVPSQPPTF